MSARYAKWWHRVNILHVGWGVQYFERQESDKNCFGKAKHGAQTQRCRCCQHNPEGVSWCFAPLIILNWSYLIYDCNLISSAVGGSHYCSTFWRFSSLANSGVPREWVWDYWILNISINMDISIRDLGLEVNTTSCNIVQCFLIEWKSIMWCMMT